MNTDLFRLKALKELSSPEQLDDAIEIVSTRKWVALIAAATLLVLMLGWGIFGTVMETGKGMGLLMNEAGLIAMVSQQAGRVTSVLVEEGDFVEVGQVLMRIDLMGENLKVWTLKRQLEELEAERASYMRGEAKSAQLRTGVSGSQSRLYNEMLENSRQKLRALGQREKSHEKLLAQGLITRSQLDDVRDLFAQEKERMLSLQKQAQVDALDKARDQQGSQAGKQSLESRIREVDDALRIETLAATDASQLTANRAGKVTGITVLEGQSVSEGAELLSIIPIDKEDDNLVAVFYLPAAAGKKALEDMDVRVSPTMIKKEEHGVMTGFVDRVAAFPASAVEIANTFKSEGLVSQVMAMGSVIRVEAELTPSSSTFSGYRWTSGSGPRLKVYEGTVCEVEVVLERHRPISLLVPYVKRKVLGIGAPAPKGANG